MQDDFQEAGLLSREKNVRPLLTKQHTFRADSKEELLDKMFVGNNLRVMGRK